jgi:signal transduction histidine kinase/CheY-like chemotaxis protein
MSTPKLASAERRATLLHAAARVAKNVTSILDPDRLLQQTVDMICDEFGFYYAGVFLIDETGQWATLQAGRGAPGAAMVAQGHKLEVGGHSMIGAATGRGEARIALDVGEEAVHFKNPFLPDTRSEMALPLIVGPEIIGALTVQSIEEAAFTQEDIETLQTMADQLAIAIKNSRLHQINQELLAQAERQSQLLKAATEVGRETVAILDLDELLPMAVDIICDAYSFYYAGIFLLDERREWAVLHAGRGAAGAAMLKAGHKLQVGGHSMIGACIANRQARIALDVGAEAVFFKNPYLPKTRSEMALPLISHGEILGAMTVQSTQEAAFSEQDIAALQAMADQLAVAIHNARLLEDLERAHAELLRTTVYEALATATTEAIHWIGNKALPITTTVERMRADLEAGDADVASLREDLELIGESARLIVEVKESLLGPAREQQPRSVDLADVVRAAAFYTGLPVDQLSVEVAPGAPLALADSTQLARAVGNLLRNAVEANARHITVSIAPTPETSDVLLIVADNGDGIAPEEMDKIWAAFYTTKGPRHSGMGLPACLHIVTQLNGRIAVESAPGMGTTFTLTLPAAEDTGQAGFDAAPQHVLLIDDSDAWARFVLETLSAAGKHVTHRTTASAGAAAEADLILVDDALNTAPVSEVLEMLKKAGAAGKTIVVAAGLRVERATEYLQFGVKDVAPKPYTAADLADLLR